MMVCGVVIVIQTLTLSCWHSFLATFMKASLPMRCWQQQNKSALNTVPGMTDQLSSMSLLLGEIRLILKILLILSGRSHGYLMRMDSIFLQRLTHTIYTLPATLQSSYKKHLSGKPTLGSKSSVPSGNSIEHMSRERFTMHVWNVWKRWHEDRSSTTVCYRLVQETYQRKLVECHPLLSRALLPWAYCEPYDWMLPMWRTWAFVLQAWESQQWAWLYCRLSIWSMDM